MDQFPDVLSSGQGTTITIEISGVFMLTVLIIYVVWMRRRGPPDPPARQ